MNSIFLDSLSVDLERLERTNRTISCVPQESLQKMGLTLHHVDVLVLTPSEPLEAIAVRHVRNLPGSIRFLLRSVGAMRRGGANLASYLLFEQGYCRELIQLGYNEGLSIAREVQPERLLGLRTLHWPDPLPEGIGALKLLRTLRTKVEIDRKRRGGVIHIRFSSEDDLIRIYDDLTGRRR